MQRPRSMYPMRVIDNRKKNSLERNMGVGSSKIIVSDQINLRRFTVTSKSEKVEARRR